MEVILFIFSFASLEVTPTTGEARELRDQYLLDVPDVQGVASRRIARGHFDVVLTSETQHRIYAYEYKFIKGFSEHRSCRPRLAVSRTNRCALLALLPLVLPASRLGPRDGAWLFAGWGGAQLLWLAAAGALEKRLAALRSVG